MSERVTATGPALDGPSGEPGPYGPRLRSFRSRAGLSQEDAASRAGISLRALRDIEHGRVQRPQARTLQRLAEVLGLTDRELDGLSAAAGDAAPRGALRPRLLILGPLDLRRGRVTVPVTSPMLRRLLGLLALKHPEPATQQEITDTLWPSGPPGSRQSLVHTYVSQVRQLLEPDGHRAAPRPAVVRTPTGYRLEDSRSRIDLGGFDELVDRAQRVHRGPEREAGYELLAQALRCWRGPVLADADLVLRQHPAAVAANERRVAAALSHADTAMLLGRAGEAVPVLGDLVHAEPLHEGLHARLILALAGSGEQAAALRVFDRLRARLDEELGVGPGAEVRDAHLRVLRRQLPPDLRHPGLPGPPPRPERPEGVEGVERPGQLGVPGDAVVAGLRTPPVPHPAPAQLPARTGPHIGRQRQILDLDALVDPDPARRPQMVAVVGAPGVGKSALAIHWAHTRREHFPDGQLYVDLRGRSRLPTLRPGDVLAQFLRALGTPPHRLPPDEDEAAALYRTLLADRRMLVLLDDARDAEQVRPLIPGAQGCAVVITSRSRLAGLVASDGARRLALDVLDPEEGRRLLGGTIGDCNVAAEEEAARELVRVCGGLPLAIRIAGANLVARNATIADQYAELAGDDMLSRLHVEGDRSSAVRAAFDLSYSALPAPVRRMFRLLSLMPGPDLTVDGAAALADAAPAESAGLLVALADAHLVQERAAGRFGLHDLLRSYARELVGKEEAHTARQRLFDWYLDHTDAAARLLYPAEPAAGPSAPTAFPAAPPTPVTPVTPSVPALAPVPASGPVAAPAISDHGQAAHWLDSERENLAGAVLEASGAGFTAVAWRLAESLHSYLSAGMYTGDCLKVATASLFAAVADGEVRAQAAAQLRRAECHGVLADDERAMELVGRALELARQSGWLDGEALALRRIGAAHHDNGAVLAAYEHLVRARALGGRDSGPGVAEELADLGQVCWKLGRLDEAAGHFAHAARLLRASGSVGEEAVARTALAVVHRALGRPGEAVRVLGETLPVHLKHGHRHGESAALSCLAGAYTDLGDHSTGRLLAHTALAAAQALADRAPEADALLALACVQERAHDFADAAGSYRESLRLARAANDGFRQTAALVGLATAQAYLEPEAALETAERAVALGRACGFRMLQGSALTVLACLRVRLGEPRTALEHGHEALALHRATGHRPGEARARLVLGRARSALGEPGGAVGHWREALRLSRATGAARIR
ncbi:BTAD domain-containing putative transcriptional regulator [Kitasatospora sp. NPDC058406]|uniref:BTAD domain-containing putative transcriptional regulator n=1 Tax=Kitasatospora sp. NPDC058406 TaxID=3346483 RepID=UPI00364E7134